MGSAAEGDSRVLALRDVTTRTTFVKCMGRMYTATALDDSEVALADVTDVTRPLALGTARRAAEDLWEVRSPRGHALLRTGDLLPALAVLREATWPGAALVGGRRRF